MTVRAVVIGTGFGARVVAPVLAATDGCEVIASVSARDDAAIAEALRAKPDLVCVHSPPFLHAAHVERAIDAGARAILCDKPFGCDSSLVDSAASAGVLGFVNFEFRFDPARRAVSDLVASGALGTVQHVIWTHHSAGSRVPLRQYGWLFDADRGGGWIGAWASHAVDTLRVLLAGELAVVASTPRTDIAERPDRDGVPHRCTAEDGVSALLRAVGGPSDGASITIDSSFAAPADIAPRIVVVARDGVIENVADARVQVRRTDGTRDDLVLDDGARERDHHLVPMRRWAATLLECVRRGAVLDGAPTFADGIACDRVLQAMRDQRV